MLKVLLAVVPDCTTLPSIVETLYFQDVEILSTMLTVAVDSPTLVIVILDNVTSQALEQSPLIQALESIVWRMRSPGCGPKPLAKLIPTEPTR